MILGEGGASFHYRKQRQTINQDGIRTKNPKAGQMKENNVAIIQIIIIILH